MTDAAVVRRNQQAAAERADRGKLLNAGKLLVGNTHTPANVGAIEARTLIAAEVDDIACEMTLRISTVTNVRGYRPDTSDADRKFTGAIDWVSLNVQHVTDPPILNSAYERLVRCDDIATTAAGAGHQRRPMAAECPSCGRRSLSWSDPAANEREASVQCTSPRCKCQGIDCRCGLPGRVPGMPHVWVQTRWEQLAARLNKQEAR
jgi:hypothetical protein